MKLGWLSRFAAIPLALAACGASDDSATALTPPPADSRTWASDSGSSRPDATLQRLDASSGGSDATLSPEIGSDGWPLRAIGRGGSAATAAGEPVFYDLLARPSRRHHCHLALRLRRAAAFNNWASPGQPMTGPT